MESLMCPPREYYGLCEGMCSSTTTTGFRSKVLFYDTSHNTPCHYYRQNVLLKTYSPFCLYNLGSCYKSRHTGIIIKSQKSYCFATVYTPLVSTNHHFLKTNALFLSNFFLFLLSSKKPPNSLAYTFIIIIII